MVVRTHISNRMGRMNSVFTGWRGRT
jgi:hypothetical protein